MKAKVRPARASDREPLMSFIKDVWGGHDYIPRIWEAWLRDEGGRMFVVEVEGVPVGMNRVRFTEDGQAWFEGVRVHPDFRGQGLASMLGDNSMEVARKRGAKVFRLTSGSRNKIAHRQIARMGFLESSRISTYNAPEGRKLRPAKEARRPGPSEAAETFRRMAATREFAIGSGVFWDQFTAITLNEKTVRRLLERGEVWTLGRATGVTRVGSEGAEKWRQICFLGGEPEDAVRLAEHLLSLKTGERAAWRFAYLPQGSPIITALRRKGYERDFALILFERAAAKG